MIVTVTANQTDYRYLFPHGTIVTNSKRPPHYFETTNINIVVLGFLHCEMRKFKIIWKDLVINYSYIPVNT